MLTPPELPIATISAHLREVYGVAPVAVTFLPLGADVRTAVYRADLAAATPLFVKLRRGALDVASVEVPRWLADLGVAQVIPPLATRHGQLWSALADFTLVVYPFVDGRDGYAVELTEEHWRALGAAMATLHSAEVPPHLAATLPRERFDPQWRAHVRGLLATLDSARPPDSAAADLAAFFRERHDEVAECVERAEALATELLGDPLPSVLCHGDAHAANVLVDGAGALYLVDWDTLILAPKERDLMFFGGAQGFRGCAPAEEVARFRRGYGSTPVDGRALAYYRYERIVQDLAAFWGQLFESAEGGEDRTLALRYVRSNFLPGGTLEAARGT